MLHRRYKYKYTSIEVLNSRKNLLASRTRLSEIKAEEIAKLIQRLRVPTEF